MSNNIQLSVPKPCHEEWDSMTPTQKGRFCGSCNKEVIDFTLMTDQQILDHLSRPGKSSCGHFMPDQLNRELVKNKNRQSGWLHYVLQIALPIVLISNRASGQSSQKCDTTILVNSEAEVRLGKMLIRNSNQQVTRDDFIEISGIVKDADRQPLPGVNVNLKGTEIRCITNSNGEFKLSVSSNWQKAELELTYVGYESKSIKIDSLAKNRNIGNIFLSPRYSTGLTSVVVVGTYGYKKRKLVNNFIKDSLNTIFKLDSIKLYPNPVARGENITIDFDLRNSGSQDIEVFNLSGQKLFQKNIQSNSKKFSAELGSDFALVPGLYLVRVTSLDSKKQVTRKLVVQ